MSKFRIRHQNAVLTLDDVETLEGNLSRKALQAVRREYEKQRQLDRKAARKLRLQQAQLPAFDGRF